MNFFNQLEFSLSGNFNSNDVLGKVKMFDQIASMTEEAKQEAIKKRMDYERRRSVFEKRKISSSSSTMQSTLLVLVNFCSVLSELLKSVHFKKPVTRSSFLSKRVVIFVVVILKMTTLFERNEDRVTGFLKWMDFTVHSGKIQIFGIFAGW